MLWPNDRHPGHEAASAISKAALKLAGRILHDDKVKVPGQIYLPDNGPGHTIGFEPNTSVDVSDTWPPALEWLGQLMAFVRHKPDDENFADPAFAAKTTLARHRGAAGVSRSQGDAARPGQPWCFRSVHWRWRR